MKRIHAWIALGTLASLGLIMIARPEPGASEPPRRARTVRELTPPAPEVRELRPDPPPPRPSGAAVLWTPPTSGSSRDAAQEAIEAAAAYLSVERSSRAAFAEAARESVRELEQALVSRQQDLSAPISENLPEDVRKEIGSRSEAEFEAARRRALERLEPFLNRSLEHLEFRRSFDTWASTVSAMSQGIYRR